MSMDSYMNYRKMGSGRVHSEGRAMKNLGLASWDPLYQPQNTGFNGKISGRIPTGVTCQSAWF